MAAPGVPDRRVRPALLLDRPGPDRGGGRVLRPVPGGHPRPLRRLRRRGGGHGPRGRAVAAAGPVQRGVRHGGGDGSAGLRRDRLGHLRAALPAGPHARLAGPLHRGPDRVEHRHQLPGLRRAEPRAGAAAAPRRAVRPRGRVPGRHVPPVRGVRGARCRRRRPRGGLRGSGAGPPGRRRGRARPPARRRPRPPGPAGHPVPVPGRRLPARAPLRAGPRRGRVLRRPDRGARAPLRRADPGGAAAGRTAGGVHPGVLPGHRGRRRDGRAGATAPRGLPPVRGHRGRPRALRRLDRRGPVRTGSGPAAGACGERDVPDGPDRLHHPVSGPCVDGAGGRRVREHRRPRPGDRRLPGDRGGRAAAVAGRDRCGRLQHLRRRPPGGPGAVHRPRQPRAAPPGRPGRT